MLIGSRLILRNRGGCRSQQGDYFVDQLIFLIEGLTARHGQPLKWEIILTIRNA